MRYKAIRGTAKLVRVVFNRELADRLGIPFPKLEKTPEEELADVLTDAVVVENADLVFDRVVPEEVPG